MQKIAFSLLILVFFSFDRPKLTRVQIAEGISVLLPKTWRPMDEMDFTQRYPSVRAPLGAYTSEDRMIDMSVNVSATQWPDANAEMAQRFFKASIYNSFDRVEMISEGVHEVNKKTYVFFEFESTVKGRPREVGQQESIMRYTYLQYLVEPGRTLVFSFNCPRRLRQDWQDTAHAVMKSIKIKK